MTETIPADIMEAARIAVGDTTIEDGTIFQHERHVLAIARAIMAHTARQDERIKELEAALTNLSTEMAHLLRVNPKKDGGLYRLRLDEASALLEQK